MQTVKPVRLAVVGVGNCAASLIQTIHAARKFPDWPGLSRPVLGGLAAGDVEIVAAFDIDARKVGRPLHDAALAQPNCAKPLLDLPPGGCLVHRAPILDGLPESMESESESRKFVVSESQPVNMVEVLRDTRVDVVIGYLPVGSDRAVSQSAEAAREAGAAYVNPIPSRVATDPMVAEAFRQAGLPVLGDDIKSQFGATYLHRTLIQAMQSRGIRVERTSQLNVGGNTDFLTMLDPTRLATKRLTKTDAVQSQVSPALAADAVRVGPSDYVPWQGDTKVAHIRLEGSGLGGSPVTLDVKLTVEDSPNSAGIAIDAIRAAALAKRNGLAGALAEPSAWLMKYPPKQMSDADALEAFERWLNPFEAVSPA